MTHSRRPLAQHLLLAAASALVAGGAHGAVGMWPSLTLWITAVLCAAIAVTPVVASARTRVVVPTLALAQAVCHGVFMAPTMAVADVAGPHCVAAQLTPGATHTTTGALFDVIMVALHTTAVVVLWAMWRHAEQLIELLALALRRWCCVPRPLVWTPLEKLVWNAVDAPALGRGHCGRRSYLRRGPPLTV